MTLKNLFKLFTPLCCLLAANPAQALGALENPQAGSYQSGIGIISGWFCDAQTIEVVFDDQPAQVAAYGTSRADTESSCGDINNGFGLLWNYALLGDGEHQVRALADGVEFARANFTVNLIDGEFVRDLVANTQVSLPGLDQLLTLEWQESLQGFVISGVERLNSNIEDMAGVWSGSWFAAGFHSGLMSISFSLQGSDQTLVPSDFLLSGTGCASTATDATPVESNDFPKTEVTLSDGSRVDVRFLPTGAFSALTGVFEFDSGPCAGFEGGFVLMGL